eukprot:TRINITY_DN3155_c0_g1_i1.p1 TRINITY_DN3155_c0_g1~~TRINITY_DN3155_c0_g1_i1.p1  ORF type:complete len:318 (+),score=38.55 TRINITY_DN3155_c0_g1_i1:134-1087(+)
MAVAQQRALLDALMGADRDGDSSRVKAFTDDDVCKNYLCGLCPHDLFTNTKQDLGECSGLHDPKLKMEYDEARKTKDFGYEKDFKRMLDDKVHECDNRIRRLQGRLEDEPDAAKVSSEDEDKLADEVKRLCAEAEKMGEEGMIDESMELMAQAESLKIELANKNRPEEPSHAVVAAQSQMQKLRVCDVCSAYLALNDTDRRLADHFGGKMHLGYMQIRELAEEFSKRSFSAHSSSSSRDRDRTDRERSDRDGGRDRDRDHRDRADRDRGRDQGDRHRHSNNRYGQGRPYDRGDQRASYDRRDRDRDHRSGGQRRGRY